MADHTLSVRLHVDAKGAAKFVDKVAAAFERFGRADPQATATPAFDALVSEVSEAIKGSIRAEVG